MADRLRVSARGAITEIVFDHPPINIYDVATRDELCDVLSGVIADPDVHVLVFSAAGDHFSAGADLKEFGTAPSVWAMRDARWGRDVWGLLRCRHRADARVDARVRGRVRFRARAAVRLPARGRRLLRRAPRGARRHDPRRAARRRPCSRVVGTSPALATILLSDRIPAHDALELGFVDEVVPRADLRARTDELADHIAARPTAAVRAAKALVWAALDLPLAEGLAREQDLAELVRSRDAVRAAVAPERPRPRGRSSPPSPYLNGSTNCSRASANVDHRRHKRAARVLQHS